MLSLEDALANRDCAAARLRQARSNLRKAYEEWVIATNAANIAARADVHASGRNTAGSASTAI